ncbi:MAG: DUF2339 domain-containing protein [Propionibacterium sp.]|nr:DUF2339 domain-containing protein [Propionibacterium sp.]
MEKNEQPTSTGPEPEPSLRDVIKAIDGLTLRMDVIISHLDTPDALPEAPRQRTNTYREQQKPATPPQPPHRPTATGPTPLQISIPAPTRRAPAAPTPPPPRTIPVSLPSPPVAKKPQPLTRDTDVTTSSPGSPDEVPLGDFFHSPEPKHPLLDSIRKRAGEATLGKYLLSAAAAVLVFLAAASLIALLWNSIPDIVKVGAVGVTAVTLTAVGMGMVSRATTNRLPAATITGIGGGLGFVSLVGAVLLGLLPPLSAFLALTGWTIILILVAARTRLPYITIITALGGLSTIGLATAQSRIHPEQSFLGLMMTVGYVAAITLTTAMTARKAVEQSRFRPLYLLSASAIGLPALFMAPVGKAREITEAGTLVAMLVLVALLFAQLILVVRAGEVPEDEIPEDETPETTPESPIGTPTNPWALAWLTAPLLIAISTLRLRPVPPPRADLDWFQHQDFTLLAVAHLVVLAVVVVPLVFKGVAAQAGQWAGHCLFVSAFVAAGILLPQLKNESLALGALIAVLALTAVPAMLAGNAIHAITVPAAVVFLTWVGHDPDIALSLVRLGALAVAVAVALILEKRLPDGPEHIVAVWLVVFLLVLRLPTVVQELLRRLGVEPAWNVTVWGILMLSVVVALIGLGLGSGHATTLPLLSGRLFGQRAHLVDDPATDTASMAPSSPVPMILTLGAAGVMQYAIYAVTSWSVLPWRPAAHPAWAFLAHELALIPFVLAVGCAVVWMMWPLVRHPWHGVAAGVTFTLSLLGMNTLLTATNVDSATSSAFLIIAGALSIVAGFRTYATAMRLYGLMLVMLMVLKLAVIDMSGQNSITRILSLLVAGVICFALSVAYSRLSAHLSGASEETKDLD